MCTEWPMAGSATVSPEATTSAKASSAATSQRTGSGWAGTPPSAASGSLTRRVHSTTESGRGPPEATPTADSSLGRLRGTGGRPAPVRGRGVADQAGRQQHGVRQGVAGGQAGGEQLAGQAGRHRRQAGGRLGGRAARTAGRGGRVAVPASAAAPTPGGDGGGHDA